MLHYQNQPTILFLAFVVLVDVVNFHFICYGQPTQHSISPIDLAALREIKNSLTEIPTVTTEFFSTWDFTSPDPCSSFSGLICSLTNPRRVISLTLGTGLSDSPGLSGSLSPSISNLTQLAQLVLFSGIVTGPIPSGLSSLKYLRVISLTHNRLTGSIPGSICTLRNLHTLDLSYNQLTGGLPNCISRLTNLKVLVLGSNRLTGNLPQLPTGLFHVDLKTNLLSGMLPNWMPLQLRYLSASGNKLSGPLNGLELISELVYLDLSMNGFSGPIPTSLFRASLTSMLLQRNNLSGRVPHPPPSWSPDVDSYGAGSIVDLSHNFLTGELTPILIGVENLFLNNNHFNGTIPKEYADGLVRGTTKTLYLQHNYFTGFPLGSGLTLPGEVSLCLAYNCLRSPPPVGLAVCPSSAGQQLSRPAYQCSAFNNGRGSSMN